jgi:hypothetical protein
MSLLVISTTKPSNNANPQAIIKDLSFEQTWEMAFLYACNGVPG